MELTEGDVTDTCHTAAWLPLLPVHSTPASSPQAADREALGGTGWRKEHRAPVREPLWDWSHLAGFLLVTPSGTARGTGTTRRGDDRAMVSDQYC